VGCEVDCAFPKLGKADKGGVGQDAQRFVKWSLKWWKKEEKT
jgi:hypothetical protein